MNGGRVGANDELRHSQLGKVKGSLHLATDEMKTSLQSARTKDYPLCLFAPFANAFHKLAIKDATKHIAESRKRAAAQWQCPKVASLWVLLQQGLRALFMQPQVCVHCSCVCVCLCVCVSVHIYQLSNLGQKRNESAYIFRYSTDSK